jgi:hypothetical protein
MKMRILALLLLALLPVLAVTATYATKPTAGKGTVTLTSSHLIGSVRTAGDNTIATYKNTFSLTGALTGTAVALERDVVHASGDKTFTTFHGEANFTSSTGDVASGTGTLVIHYVGVNNGTLVHGQFVASDGTGSFADFHGQGEFSGKVAMPLVLSYTISWHIDPQPRAKGKD